MQAVTIFGIGHGGLALGAHFAASGLKVCLGFDENHPGFVNNLQNNKGVIKTKGLIESSAQVSLITSNFQKAVEFAKIIFLCLPANAHESVFRKISPLLTSEHKIFTLSGNFSSISLQHILSGFGKNSIVADIASFPYACRAEPDKSEVNIFGQKQKLGIAALPANKTKLAIDAIADFFPSKLVEYKNVLEVGLNATSGISHPVVTIFNAGRIKKGANYHFYRDGISDPLEKILIKLDEERRHIGKLCGFELPDYLTLMREFYGESFASIGDFFRQSKVHNTVSLAPDSLYHRYISQDVPFILVPWYSLGKLLGYDSALLHHLIAFSSIINGEDYLISGRNIENLGINNILSLLSENKKLDNSFQYNFVA